MWECYEIGKDDFDSAKKKNKYIRSSDAEWIGFADSSITGKEEVCQILDENPFLQDYDAVVFGKDCFDGEITLLDLLECPQSIIYAFCFKREILVKTGSFNELLQSGTNYEFLLRVAEVGRVYFVSCDADKEWETDAYTMAYIMRRYMPFLKESGRLNEVFLRVVELAGRYGIAEQYNNTMNLLLNDTKEYEKLVENTAPFLVFVGTDICAGVITEFANSLADELVGLGQAVITNNNRYGNYNEIPTERLMSQKYKAIVGFQAPAMGKEIIRKMNGRRIQFLLDNPAFLKDFFQEGAKETYFLCQDGYYAEYIREYYTCPHAVQFPPGGTIVKKLPEEKIYDITFVGNYEMVSECPYTDDYEKGYYEYMLEHPDNTFEQGLYDYGQILGIEYSKAEIRERLADMKNLCLNILHRDRHVVIEEILSAGIQLHVFSDNWNMYDGKCKENLIIHPMIFGEEPYHVWAQSKIGLNIMRGHKAGMTERIANIMLCGACCLSDETVYLNDNFIDGEDIVLFSRKDLNALPEKIKYLLAHDEERERIAREGQKKALAEHTWRTRAEELLTLLEKQG